VRVSGGALSGLLLLAGGPAGAAESSYWIDRTGYCPDGWMNVWAGAYSDFSGTQEFGMNLSGAQGSVVVEVRVLTDHHPDFDVPMYLSFSGVTGGEGRTREVPPGPVFDITEIVAASCY
jgi:hypothetical protein